MGWGASVTGFISACLYVFAVCAAIGMAPGAVLAAVARKPGSVVMSVLIAAFVIWVLCMAAGDLHA